MTDSFSPLMQNMLYCHHHDLLGDEVGQALHRAYQAGVCDATLEAMIASRAAKHKHHQAFCPDPPFQSAKLHEGDYVLGSDLHGRELRSRVQYLNAHCQAIAGSGAGKTMLAHWKIPQIAAQVRGMFLFDLRKREFAKQQPLLKQQGIDLRIVAGRSMKINPLQLPLGVTEADWIPRVADMLIEVLGLPPRASKLLQAKLFPLYRRFASQPDEFPTLFDLFEAIKADKGANHQARLAILDSLEPVLLSLGPKVLAWRRGWGSDELTRRHLVFELGGCSEVDKDLLLNTLILSEFTSRIARGISNPAMDLWICLDEAQRLCSGSGTSSAISDLIGLIRGTGIGLDLSLQSSSGLQPSISSNTATKILGRCGSMADYTAAGTSMALSSEQIQWAQLHLTPGLFIGQLAEGPWRHPFVFRVPLVRFPALASRIPPDTPLECPVKYAEEFDLWGQTPELTTQPPTPTPGKSQSPTTQSLFTSEQEYRFCKAVAEHPTQPASRYPKLAGIAAKSAKRIREELIAKGFLREHLLDTGRPGRSSILLDVLEPGKAAIRRYEEGIS